MKERRASRFFDKLVNSAENRRNAGSSFEECDNGVFMNVWPCPPVKLRIPFSWGDANKRIKIHSVLGGKRIRKIHPEGGESKRIRSCY